MQEIDLSIDNLLGKEHNLIFLIGAGCSIDAPSCLLDSRTMMKEIVKFTCAESEIEKVLELDDLKYEVLLEIVREQIDPDLKVLDYYGLCNKPNIHHFFFADAIKKGNIIITTNFDSLIEYALLQLNVSKEDITTLITRNDYGKFNEKGKELMNGVYTLFKIHGSVKNIITNEDTRDYLISLIEKLGSYKSPFILFQVEPFKRSLLENILNDRTLIVMGYSGFNDYDVTPTLRSLKNLKKIVWINHIENNNNKEEIVEIRKSENSSQKEMDKLNKILLELKQTNPNLPIYRIDANTTNLIRKVLTFKPDINSENFAIDFQKWIKEKISILNPIKKLIIPHIIYFNFDRYDDALNCAEEALNKLDETRDLSDKMLLLNNIGWIYYSKGNYSEAIIRFEEALLVAGQIGDSKKQTAYLNSIGEIYEKVKSYSEAIERYKMAINIADSSGDLSEKLRSIENIIEICEAINKFDEALKGYEEALKIVEKMGDLQKKSIYLNNIAVIHYNRDNVALAQNYFQQAEEIIKNLNIPEKTAIFLNNMGAFYQKNKYYSKALEKLNEALSIDEKTGNLEGKVWRLNKIANVYQDLDKSLEALESYKKALQTADALNNAKMKANLLNDIGKIYFTQKNFTDALQWFKDALRVSENLNNLELKADFLNNIAGCYFRLEDYEKSLKYADESLQNLRLYGLGDSAKAKILRKRIEELKKKGEK